MVAETSLRALWLSIRVSSLPGMYALSTIPVVVSGTIKGILFYLLLFLLLYDIKASARFGNLCEYHEDINSCRPIFAPAN